MANTTPRVQIYVRHSAGCKFEADEFSNRCPCRKWLRWTKDGVRHRRKANTRRWEEAEQVKREIEDHLSGKTQVDDTQTSKDLGAAIDLFITTKRIEKVKTDTLNKYRRELNRLVAHANKESVYVVQGVESELLTRFLATWEDLYPSSQTRSVVRARLTTFLRYCYQSKWLSRIPPLPKITVDVVPTMPLEDDEYQDLLEATGTLEDIETQQRSRALFRLMRHTGLAVGDSLKLLRARMKYDKAIGRWRVETYRQKTGTHVSVIIPTDLATELTALPIKWVSKSNGSERKIDPKYFFWDGRSDIVNSWTRKTIPKCFKAAGIEKVGNTTSHRIRDTFAVDLLQKGVPMEEVSKLLGHKSIKTTERSYAKWVKGRQDRLDMLVMDALAA